MWARIGKKSGEFCPPRAGEGIRQINHALLPLEESLRRLIEKLNQVYRDLTTDDDLSRMKEAGAVDMTFFKWLVSSVTLFAINMLRDEWKVILQADRDNLGPCACEILQRYSLPCKHYLYRIVQNGQPIPRSLLHPRWWLGGPVVSVGFSYSAISRYGGLRGPRCA